VVCVDLQLAPSLYHSAGASQVGMLELLSREASGRSADGGVGVLSTSEFTRFHGAEVSGRALSVSVGCGGAVWTKDLNERMGRSRLTRYFYA
jgi:hypothetical protein